MPEPSRSDKVLTHALQAALSMIDLKVLDHLVVAGSNVTSFAGHGLL